jgi:hypothetical protein
MYSPLLEKLDVLVLRHVCSHPLPLSVQSLGAGSSSRHLNVNSLSPRRSDEDATTTRPKRARRRCSAVNLREAQDSAVPNGKHASDEPLTRSRLFTSAPVARSAAGEIRAVPGRRLETRVARRAGLHTNCPYEKYSWSNSWSTSPDSLFAAVQAGDVSTVAARSDLARTTTDVPMSDDNAAPPPAAGSPSPGAPKLKADAPAFSFNANAADLRVQAPQPPLRWRAARLRPAPGPPPGGPPVFFERPAAPTGPPAKAKSLAIGGEAPKKAATVTIGGDGAPQFFERPAPPEGAPAKAKALSIGGDAAPAKASPSASAVPPRWSPSADPARRQGGARASAREGGREGG